MDHPRAALHEPLPPVLAERWGQFGRWPRTYFPSFVGLVLEEVRSDYARMRLPYRPELEQPAGVVHGGALATLIDTVVVPAIGGVYDVTPVMLTLSMQVSFIGAVRGQDAIAEGWIDRRGRSTVFCSAEVRGEDGALAATGSLVYAVRHPKPEMT